MTAANAAGGVTVATAPVFIATPGTLRAQVEALATSAGRTSTAALKTPGVDALPSGVTLSGKTITLSGAGATLENWNLTGLLVQMNGADQTVRQCVLGEADGVAGILYYVQTGPDATNPTVENCDLFGFEGVGGSGAFVNQQTSGGEVDPERGARADAPAQPFQARFRRLHQSPRRGFQDREELLRRRVLLSARNADMERVHRVRRRRPVPERVGLPVPRQTGRDASRAAVEKDG